MADHQGHQGGGPHRQERRTEAELHAASLTALCIAMLIIPSVAVALRFWSRLTRSGSNGVSLRVGLWWDDWATLAALPFMFTQTGLMLRWANIGLPRHGVMGADEVSEGLKLFYIGNFMWNIANSVARLAAVLLYARVFTTANKHFKIAIWIAGALVGVRLIIGVVGNGMICLPAYKAWDPNQKDAACGHGSGVLVGGQILFVVIDIMLLCLPLPMLWRLRLTTKQRILVGLTLFYGYCVPVVSVGTLIANVQAHGSFVNVVNWKNVTLLYWTLLEAPLAVITICLPPIFFLIKRRFRPISRSISRNSRDRISRLKSVDSRLSSTPLNQDPEKVTPSDVEPEKVQSWPVPKAPQATLAPSSNRSSRHSFKFPLPSSFSISKPYKSSDHSHLERHFSSNPMSKPRYSTPVAINLNDKPLPPVELSSDLLSPAGSSPEYQTHIFTPAGITGVRRADRKGLENGMIRVEREVNITVRDGRSDRPLKDMLDTGLGLDRENRQSR